MSCEFLCCQPAAKFIWHPGDFVKGADLQAVQLRSSTLANASIVARNMLLCASH